MAGFWPSFFNLKFIDIIERAFHELPIASDTPREVLGVPELRQFQISNPMRHTFLTILFS